LPRSILQKRLRADSGELSDFAVHMRETVIKYKKQAEEHAMAEV